MSLQVNLPVGVPSVVGSREPSSFAAALVVVDERRARHEASGWFTWWLGSRAPGTNYWGLHAVWTCCIHRIISP